MKRFIRYLYEYEGNQKKRNVGFVKVEQDGKEAMISVHGKGLCGKSNENISCYLIKMDSETGNAVLIPAGELRIRMPSCGGCFCYTEEMVRTGSGKTEQNCGQSCGIEENVCGMGLGNPEGPFYMALWNEEMYGDLDITKAVVEVEKTEEDGTVCKAAKKSAIYQENRTEKENESENLEKAESQQNQDITSQNSQRQIMKIQRGEISILPRCEWRLANNNFLLHGYYNYRHLVLIDEGDKLKLGVPGIYHEREARAAATFGFPEFIAEADVKVTLEPQERNEDQQFGYWCRQVRRPPR